MSYFTFEVYLLFFYPPPTPETDRISCSSNIDQLFLAVYLWYSLIICSKSLFSSTAVYKIIYAGLFMFIEGESILKVEWKMKKIVRFRRESKIICMF